MKEAKKAMVCSNTEVPLGRKCKGCWNSGRKTCWRRFFWCSPRGMSQSILLWPWFHPLRAPRGPSFSSATGEVGGRENALWEPWKSAPYAGSPSGHLQSEVVKTVFLFPYVFAYLVVVYLKIKITQKLNRCLINFLPGYCMCQKPHSKIIPRQFSNTFYLSASLLPY